MLWRKNISWKTVLIHNQPQNHKSNHSRNSQNPHEYCRNRVYSNKKPRRFTKNIYNIYHTASDNAVEQKRKQPLKRRSDYSRYHKDSQYAQKISDNGGK